MYPRPDERQVPEKASKTLMKSAGSTYISICSWKAPRQLRSPGTAQRGGSRDCWVAAIGHMGREAKVHAIRTSND